MSLWTFSQPSHLASTVPAFQPLGLTLLMLVVSHTLHVNLTCEKMSKSISPLKVNTLLALLRLILQTFYLYAFHIR